jgi:hypothetical protein
MKIYKRQNRSCFIICIYLLICKILFSSSHHCCRFQWVMGPFPIIPVDPIVRRLMFSFQVQAIQVCMVTILIPPTTFKLLCTIITPYVDVFIFCRNFLSIVRCHWISWKYNNTTCFIVSCLFCDCNCALRRRVLAVRHRMVVGFITTYAISAYHH